MKDINKEIKAALKSYSPTQESDRIGFNVTKTRYEKFKKLQKLTGLQFGKILKNIINQSIDEAKIPNA